MRQEHDALACRGLGRPGDERAVYQFHDGYLYPKRARGRIDVALAECGQFSPAQAAEDREQDERPVALVDRVGQAERLADGQHGPFG
jgi:hypothetical protein